MAVSVFKVVAAIAVVVVAAAGGALLIRNETGRASDPALVRQQAEAADSAVMLKVEWARFGGTATYARISGSSDGAKGVNVNFEDVALSGFQAGGVAVVEQDPSAATLRLPAIDTSTEAHSVTFRSLAVLGDEGIRQVQGAWRLVLELPAPEERDEVFQIERLSTVAILDGAGELTAVRSRAETLITYSLPPGVTPLGPPEMVDDDGAITLATELPAPLGGGSSQGFAVLPATPFGEDLVIRLGPLFDATDEVRQATIDIASFAGRVPANGEALEVFADGEGEANELRIVRAEFYSHPHAEYSDWNLDLEVNVHLGDAVPVNDSLIFQSAASTFLVTDARGVPMRVRGKGTWTGSPPSEGNPGVPPGSLINVFVERKNDIGAVTLTLFGSGELIQAGEALQLTPIGKP
jgi:hypothetical protein